MNDKGFFCPDLSVYVGGHMLWPPELSDQETLRSYEKQLLNK